MTDEKDRDPSNHRSPPTPIGRVVTVATPLPNDSAGRCNSENTADRPTVFRPRTSEEKGVATGDGTRPPQTPGPG